MRAGGSRARRRLKDRISYLAAVALVTFTVSFLEAFRILEELLLQLGRYRSAMPSARTSCKAAPRAAVAPEASPA